MLISCRFSIVGLHLLLFTHIAHSFVLLTANVDDVKKIARKFVSDSLAEKIADFITRATETMAHSTKVSEENEDNTGVHESSQVSAENRMYDPERHGFESQAADTKSKKEIVLEKVTVKIPRKTSAEKKKHKFEEPSTHKPRKQPKPLHGRSRYIAQTENKASPVTEKALSKEDKYDKMKESIQLLEDNLFSTPDGETKTKKQKKKHKGRAYKLLSAFDTVENDAAKDGTPDGKGVNDDDRLFNVRAMDEEKAVTLPTEEAATEIVQHVNENEKQMEKAVSVFDQHEVKDEKNTEKVATNEPLHLTGTDEFDHDENKIIEKTEKEPTSISRSFVTERDVKEENWWEKELPAHAHEVNSKGKSWF